MFLRGKKRRKGGKEHFYWSVVENRRISAGRVLQRQVLYLGELNGRREASWRKTVELFGEDPNQPSQVALFDENHLPSVVAEGEVPIVAIRLSGMRLVRPRQWGACWLGCELWRQLALDTSGSINFPQDDRGARWDKILQVLTLYRLIAPGSEWRLHRHWFEQSALADLLGEDFGLAEIHRRLQTSPRDLGLIARTAMQQPLFRRIVSTREALWHRATSGERTLWNHNHLLKSFPGCCGVKTGYTSPAQQVLVSAAVRDGREAIAVAMHSNKPGIWEDSKKLLDRALSFPAPPPEEQTDRGGPR